MAALPRSFFNRPTLAVAEELVGCGVTVTTSGTPVTYRITETEAYDGPLDLASHAARGKTVRNAVMFRDAGYLYVYLCYGIHWLLNVVTGPAEYPAAVLIRGVETIDGVHHFNGPGKLTKALGVDGRFNGLLVSKKIGLWFEPLPLPPNWTVITTPRIGVDYAGPIWAKKPYRFLRVTAAQPAKR